MCLDKKGGVSIEKNQSNRKLKCIKFGSTKFSNYSKNDIDYLFINIEIEIRNYYAKENSLINKGKI